VRAFGLLHPAHRATLRRLQLRLAQDVRPPAPDTDEHDDPPPARPPLRCPRCLTPTLKRMRRLSAEECLALARAATAAPAQARAPPAMASPLSSTTAVMS
jgi:hypothetical protein